MVVVLQHHKLSNGGQAHIPNRKITNNTSKSIYSGRVHATIRHMPPMDERMQSSSCMIHQSALQFVRSSNQHQLAQAAPQVYVSRELIQTLLSAFRHCSKTRQCNRRQLAHGQTSVNPILMHDVVLNSRIMCPSQEQLYKWRCNMKFRIIQAIVESSLLGIPNSDRTSTGESAHSFEWARSCVLHAHYQGFSVCLSAVHHIAWSRRQAEQQQRGYCELMPKVPHSQSDQPFTIEHGNHYAMRRILHFSYG